MTVKNSGGRPQGQTANYQKQAHSTRIMVEGGIQLQNRVKRGDHPKEVFVYAGNVRIFNEAPRGSDFRIAALTLPAGESASSYVWPVEGFEILVILNGFGVHQTRLLVAELFSYGAVRVSVNHQRGNRLDHGGVYSQEACA